MSQSLAYSPVHQAPTNQAYGFIVGDSRSLNGYKLSNVGDVAPEILTAQ